MTPDDRAQLIEDIERSAHIRHGIVEQARLSPKFDLVAAWQELDAIDASIQERMAAAAAADPDIDLSA
jgi:hypothetical protein